MLSMIEKLWYQHRWLALPLLPLSFLFHYLATRRKAKLLAQDQETLSVPVIVVGNITVGGTGKTPLVIALVQFLQSQGFKPGVISRGFGGQANYPYQLDAQSTSKESGDEPLLIALSCQCPVVVAPKRKEAAAYLLDNNDVDIIISDDGLQHYALYRDIEICVVDGQRQLGNGFCLPAGPLREPPSRLNSVDFVVVNGKLNEQAPTAVSGQFYTMLLQTQPLKALPFSDIEHAPKPNSAVHAVAAIGNPQRFFDTLSALNYDVEAHRFVDHHHYQLQDMQFDDDKAVIMTEKDAVKCLSFADLDKHFYLPVAAQLPANFWQSLLQKIQTLK